MTDGQCKCGELDSKLYADNVDEMDVVNIDSDEPVQGLLADIVFALRDLNASIQNLDETVGSGFISTRDKLQGIRGGLYQ